MGAVTGKGLSDLIREEFGFRVTFFLMLALVVTNFGNVDGRVRRRRQQPRAVRHLAVHRRAARGRSSSGCSSCRAPTAASRRSSSSASAFYVCYIVAGVLAHPDWKAAAFATVTRPRGRRHPATTATCYMVIGLVGTTIAPWMQFYLQASIVEKGVTVRQYRASRWDVIVGCLFAAIVAWFIIVACAATLHTVGQHRDPRRGRRGAGAAAAGRRVRVPAVRRRAVQRLALRGVDPADFDRRTRSAKGWGSSRGSTRNSTKRRRSTGSTRC